MVPSKDLRSWLRVQGQQGLTEDCWVVLDNGIISVYRKPDDCFPKFVFPLHSAIVTLNKKQDKLTVCCKITNSKLVLSTAGTQLLNWNSSINAAVKEWSNKKRMSILYKNRFSNTKDLSIFNNEDVLFTSDEANAQYHRLCAISHMPEGERLSWTQLPEVVASGYAKQLSQDQLDVNELTFELFISELVYHQELAHLLKLTRASIYWKDSLPLYNRRSIIGCVIRVKKRSNILVKWLAKEWATADSLSRNLYRLYDILESYYDASTAQTLVAYCDVLDDARSMIRRVMLNDSSLMTHAFSARCHIEYSLLPLRHLNQTHKTLQKISQLLHSSENQHYLPCQQLILTITGILDYCYNVFRTHHGSNYLADIDNLLDFSSKLSTLKLKKISLQSSVINKKYNSKQTSSSTSDNIINTKIEINESFNLIDLRSVENLMIESTIDTKSSTSESEVFSFKNSSNISSSNRECYEMIELRTNKLTRSSVTSESEDHSNAHNFVDNEILEESQNTRIDKKISSTRWYCDDRCLNGKQHILQKSFVGEPLYQAYAQSNHQPTMGVEEKSPKLRTNSVFYTYLDLPENIYEEIDKDKKQCSSPKPTIGLRTLWCETDEIIESGVLNKMSSFQKALQESKFEILTSEVSYLKSINVLITLFVESTELAEVLNPEERRALFSNIIEVRRTSEIFLFDLAGHWEEDYMLSNIYSVVHRHALASFRVYIEYCSNQVRFHKTLQHLLIYNKDFMDIIMRIETSPECHGYSLQSFLSLPMQRVTRLPLLLQAIQRRLTVGTSEYTSCRVTLSALNQLVHDCNEAVRKIEQTEHIQALNNILDQTESTEEKTEPTQEKPKKRISLTKTWKLFSLQES